jgi:hypothetical protein
MWPNHCIPWPLIKLVTGASSEISYSSLLYFLRQFPVVSSTIVDDHKLRLSYLMLQTLLSLLLLCKLSLPIQAKYCGSRPYFALKSPSLIIITFPEILSYVSVNSSLKISFTLSYFTFVVACSFIIQMLMKLELMININIRSDTGLNILMYGINVLWLGCKTATKIMHIFHSREENCVLYNR